MKTKRDAPRRAIDWQDVRARLARASEAMNEGVHLTPEQARAVMDERALTLARVPARAPDAAEVLQVATYMLADERYAIESRHVRRVVRLSESGPVAESPDVLTPIPGAPDFLLGVINLRGDILAVIDLRKFFGLAERPLTDLSRVVVLGGDRDEFGILADSVQEVLTLRIDEVHEPPGSVTGVGRQYLRGVTKDALIVLDGAVLLQDSRLVIDQVEEAGA